MKPFWREMWEKEFTAELIYTVIAAVILTAVTYLFAQIPLTRDRMVPFRSVGFVLGSGAVFYFAVTISIRQALYLAASNLTLIALVWIRLSDMSALQICVCLTLVTIYYLGLIFLPNLIPFACENEAAELVQKNKQMQERLSKLHDEVNRRQQQDVVQRAATDRKEQVRLSSRSTLLNSFARDLLQAGSSGEILKVTFNNVMKILACEECVMALITPGAKEATLNRVAHPNAKSLEQTKIPVTGQIIAQVLRTKAPVSSKPPATFVQGVTSRYAFPIVLDGQVIAVFNLGVPKSGDLSDDDPEIISVVNTMVAGSIEQLRIASGSA